jgi:malate dehydrogenase (oxaloacetate-decarboxylating)(NADP+)
MRCATTPSWPPAAPITRTRSTTSCVSPISSAVRWTPARRPSPWRWKSRPCTPLPSWPRRNKAKWWQRPTPAQQLAFGPEYLIPKPFDPRLMMKIAPAVAQAAADSGVALRPIADMDAYRGAAAKLRLRVRHGHAADLCRRQEGREQTRGLLRGRGGARVLRASQIVVDERLARAHADRPPSVIAQRIQKFGLRLREGVDYNVVNVEHDARYRDFWQTYHRMTERKGVTVQMAKIEMRRRLTLIGAMLLHKGDVDGMICGTWGTTAMHLLHRPGHRQTPGRQPQCTPGRAIYACMNGLLLPGGRCSWSTPMSITTPLRRN